MTDTFEIARLAIKGDVELYLEKRRTWLSRVNGHNPKRREGIEQSISLYEDLLEVIENSMNRTDGT